MINYNIIVYLDNGSEIILPVKYDSDYNLRRDITSIGINGVLQKIEERYDYYPPHRINKIEVVKNELPI